MHNFKKLQNYLKHLPAAAGGFWKSRSTQAGTNALVATLSILAILGIVNFLAVRYSARIDLTENQLFTLSPQTQATVRNLEQPLQVFVFDSDPNPGDRELLKTYRRYSPNFAFEFVDPDLQPGLVRQFQVKSPGDVYLQYGDKKQLVQTLMTFGQKEPLSEIKLTNGIEKIQRDRLQTIYFLQGHGERPLDNSPEGLSEATTSLEDKGFKVQPLNLAETPAIPENASAIVIAGAKRKLFEPEVQALKKYADGGGNLMVMSDPETDAGLEALLKPWGVELDRRIVLDGSGAGNLVGLGPATPIVTTYGDHPVTQDFKQGISFFPLARPVATVKTEGVEAMALLVTSDRMWAESDLESEQAQFDPSQDLPGPFDLGVALTRPLPGPKPKKEGKEVQSKLVVIGNSSFATNQWFQEQLNGDVFLNSVQWLASRDEQPLSIRPREAKNRRINLTPLQARALGWLSLVAVPLFGLGLAALTWWRRR